VILSETPVLEPSSFYFNPADEHTEMVEAISIEEMERLLIAKSLEKNNRNLSVVAASLGISRPTLYARMKKYRLE
jgi:transcriptional regulator with PAS, ATPase and Fis domain